MHSCNLSLNDLYMTGQLAWLPTQPNAIPCGIFYVQMTLRCTLITWTFLSLCMPCVLFTLHYEAEEEAIHYKKAANASVVLFQYTPLYSYRLIEQFLVHSIYAVFGNRTCLRKTCEECRDAAVVELKHCELSLTLILCSRCLL